MMIPCPSFTLPSTFIDYIQISAPQLDQVFQTDAKSIQSVFTNLLNPIVFLVNFLCPLCKVTVNSLGIKPGTSIEL